MKKHEKTIRINYLLMHLLREILTGSKCRYQPEGKLRGNHGECILDPLFLAFGMHESR